MKSQLRLLLTVCSLTFGFAQNSSEHYLFDQFEQGSFLMKNGKTSSEMVNYNTITNEVVIWNSGKMMIPSTSSVKKIDTIYIKGRTFIPDKEKFVELLINSEGVQLLIDYECTLNSVTETINPHNRSSSNVSNYLTSGGIKDQTSRRKTEDQVQNKSELYELVLPSNYSTKLRLKYHYIKDNKKRVIKNMNQLKKLYSNHTKEFKTYTKQNNVEFENQMRVKSLIEYLEKLN